MDWKRQFKFGRYKLSWQKRVLNAVGSLLTFLALYFGIPYYNKQENLHSAYMAQASKLYANIRDTMQDRFGVYAHNGDHFAILAAIPKSLLGSKIKVNGIVVDYSAWLYDPAFAGSPTDSYAVVIANPNVATEAVATLGGLTLTLGRIRKLTYAVGPAVKSTKVLQFNRSQLVTGNQLPLPSNKLIILALFSSDGRAAYAYLR